MIGKFRIEDIITMFFVLVTTVYRIFTMNKLKKEISNKEGREYVANKGGYKIIALDALVFLSVIVFILVTALKLNMLAVILLEAIVVILLVLLNKKFSKNN